MREQFRPEDLEQYAIAAADADFEGAVGGGAGLKAGGLVTVKAADGKSAQKGRKRGADAKTPDAKQGGKHGGGKNGGGSSGKKHKSSEGRQQKKGKPRQ